MDDLPPWDDINPPVTALARTSAPLSASLEPAPREDFARELTKCLSLVAPVGMDENARTEWLAAAWETVQHLPADLLAIGAAHARKVADHPSKIVPAIIAETEELLKCRRESAKKPGQPCLPAPSRRNVMDRRGEPMSAEDTAELNRVLELNGATARYREDGSKYHVQKAAAA